MTSSEIETIDDQGLELLPARQPTAATARASLREHALAMQDAYTLAKGICGDGRNGTGLMVPQRFRGKPEEAAAAILYGAELGLNPLQAVQRVVPIHGMPSLEARTMVGLLIARGYRIRTVEQSDTSVTVEGEAPNGESSLSTWTIQRAIQAGYVPTPTEKSQKRPDVESDWVTVTKQWGNDKPKTSIVGNMKYITDPQTMLKAKAQAEVCRELAPDVLMGISYSREDLESEDQRQFDRMDERGAAPARVSTSRVTENEIFAEEVPLSTDSGSVIADNPPSTSGSDIPAKDIRADVTPETPAGAAEPQDADATSPAPDPAATPAPAEPPATSNRNVKPEPEQAKAPAKKAPAKKAPPREVSKLRAPLEKRLFTLLGDAGLSGDKDRDGRIAVYRAITGRDDVSSTNDLDDTAIAKVCDQLYVWSQQNELDDQIADILSDAARKSAAPAADPTSEGN